MEGLRWSDRHFGGGGGGEILFSQFCYVYSFDIPFTILKYFYLAHIQYYSELKSPIPAAEIQTSKNCVFYNFSHNLAKDNQKHFNFSLLHHCVYP